MCHGEVAEPSGIKTPDRHVDGKLDLAIPTACTGCHGTNVTGALNDAAPVDAAHAAHLASKVATIPCETCHKVPKTVQEAGHFDHLPPATVTFTGVALTGGLTPSITAGTCSGTYCHGTATPAWSKAKSGAACNVCHGAPPGGVHPKYDKCEKCHSTVAGAGPVIIDATLHLNGKVDYVVPPCNACHGTAFAPLPTSGDFQAFSEALKKLSQVTTELEKGGDFGEVAKKYSDDASADKGGELGWIARGTLGEYRAEQEIFGLAAGAVSSHYSGTNATTIYKVLEKDGSRALTDEQKTQVRSQAYDYWLEKLKQDRGVRRLVPGHELD